MNEANTTRLATLSCALGLAALLSVGPTIALAQQPAPAKPEATPVEAKTGAQASASTPSQGEAQMEEETQWTHERPRVGDATQGLLAWQRSGEVASPTPRPIAGNVANRSYERYLKSFEFPIPERMSSTVKSSSGSGSGADTGAPK